MGRCWDKNNRHQFWAPTADLQCNDLTVIPQKSESKKKIDGKDCVEGI